MRRRTITRLAIAGPVALILGLSAAGAAQAGCGCYMFEDAPNAELVSADATPDGTYTI